MAAGPALAQSATPDDDPIAALLLDHRGDADEPATPPSAAPGRPQLTAPVLLEETGKTADGPPSERDIAYENRLRAAFAAAASFQGPLEGGWTLAARSGPDLYALRIVDRRDRLEGVWRDLRRAGGVDASGLIDDIQRSGGEITLRFTPAEGAPPAVAVLHGDPDGRWAGELTQGPDRRAVLLKRAGS
ncbi:MAG TPA: hypothetical protein VHN73_05670 [Phenylobacterium sp.]|nr:hypothetical protein [Phenylobacterium sp.]